jgi:nitrate reductase assembly molybdenum cofactor insertion protein NarJ
MAHYASLAALLDYPTRDYPVLTRRAQESLEMCYPLVAEQLGGFLCALPASGDLLPVDALSELQEIYTRSFDIQPITTLSTGYILFGDDYKRGELMVNLGREQREAGIDCGSELPDHLPNVLRLIANWSNLALREEFVTEILHPALERMLAEFSVHRTAERDQAYLRHFRTMIDVSEGRRTLFAFPLAAVLEVLRSDFDLVAPQVAPRNSDFLRSVVRELELESDDHKVIRRSPV